MPGFTRRAFLASATASLALPAIAQTGHHHHGDHYESLHKPGRVGLPEIAKTQWVYDSPAKKAANPGRWIAKAPLPLPRSEMAWATAHDGKMHVVGGYSEQRVDRPYHHVYEAAADRWIDAAPLPRGANHVGVAFLGDDLYAIGGHLEQNRKPHSDCFVYNTKSDRWRKIAPLPRACGAISCIALNGIVHAVGGAIGDDFATKKSVDWHIAYDPTTDKWTERRPMPTGRDHTGIVVIGDLIHVVGGRVDTFHTNSNLHHAYDPKKDVWTPKRPLPTARSGHGAVIYRGKMFVMGGEGTDRVFAQNEAYDPASDTWEQYAPMTTPRHGLGAAVIGDAIYVAGGGPVVGGGFQSAVHEAFTLA